MKIQELLNKLNEIDTKLSEEPKGKPIEELVSLEARKLGLEFDLTKNEEIKMNTNDLLIFCDNFYEMGFEDGANSLNENINENALERYLSVEYNEAHPDKQILALYNGPAVMDSVEIDLKYPLHTNAQEIRDIAKQHFDNITDDIRVAWY